MIPVLEENELNIDKAMSIVFSKLDEAFEDVKNGKIQTVDEAWKEIDEV